MKKFLLLLVLPLLMSCGKEEELNKQIETQKTEITKLTEEIEKLRTETLQLNSKIEELENSESNFIVKIEKELSESNFDKAHNLIEEFYKKYPLTTNKEKIEEIKKKIEVAVNEKKKAEELAQKQKEEENKKALEAIKTIPRKYDEFKDTTWVNSYNWNQFSNINVYYGVTGKDVIKGTYWPRIVFQMSSSDWVFFTKVIIKIDEYTYTKDFKYNDVVRDSGGGRIYEEIDLLLDSKEEEMIEKLIASGKGKMRFSGKYTKDINISSKDIERIKKAILFRTFRENQNKK